MKNIVTDFFNFLLILVYWVLAILILLPIRYIDRVFGSRMFICIDRKVKKITNG